MLEHDRRIAAILAADVVGYSRLMGVDEESTLAGLKLRRSIFDQLVAEYGGHEFGSVGDSLMAEFPSAVNAVRCAQAIQQAVGRENEPLPADRRMALRIGINLGDVINENGTLFGDGVNVAARLQSLTAPGGILIAGAVYEQVKKKLPTRFNYVGLRHVKNIPDPLATYEVLEADERHPFLKGFVRYTRRRRVGAIAVLALLAAGVLLWIWRGDITATQLQSLLQPAAPPSVAVLPFVNMSSEPDNEPFADGLSEEVLNVLAGIQGLKVAGRTSSFYFKGKSEKPDVIAATLGVNHLLEGSVRWAGPKVRITAQLIDANNGFHLWSQTFDREITDVFAVQEEIARSVAGALRVELLPADETHLAKRGTQNPEAHQLYLVARGRMRERGLANLHVAKALFDSAIERDPLYANAYSGLADAYYLLISNHGEGGEQQGSRAAKRALELDPTSSEAYVSRANFAALRYDSHGEVEDLELALAYYQRAIELDPSNAQAYHWYGATVMERDPDRALRFLERAIELDPLLRPAQVAVAQLYDTRGQYEKARRQMNEVIDRYPDFASAYNDLGRLEYSYGHVGDARMRYRQAYELEADQGFAMAVYFTSVTLGDRAAAAEWLPRFAGSPYSEMMAKAVPLSMEGKYLLALESFERGLEVIENPELVIRIVIRMSHLELIVGHPERATILLLKQYPELARDETAITLLNCDAAIALATSWQRTKQRQVGDRLLRRIAAWLDGPGAPRWPQTRFVRAQVHALLGERDQAFDALDRAYDEGYRSTLGSSLNFFFHAYWGENTPMLEGVRSDPRFSAWFARIHADNARQLAQLESQRASIQ